MDAWRNEVEVPMAVVTWFVGCAGSWANAPSPEARARCPGAREHETRDQAQAVLP